MTKTLLIYDDEPAIGQLISKVAEQAGFAPAVAVNDQDFWMHYNGGNPAAILVDLYVPGTSGIELLDQLAAKKCAAPIFVMSGYHKEILGSARRLGGSFGLDVRDILVKPFSVDDLKSKLRGIQ